jgi:hypothetical protein
MQLAVFAHPLRMELDLAVAECSSKLGVSQEGIGRIQVSHLQR